jgi:hypothetical protein
MGVCDFSFVCFNSHLVFASCAMLRSGYGQEEDVGCDN